MFSFVIPGILCNVHHVPTTFWPRIYPGLPFLKITMLKETETKPTFEFKINEHDSLPLVLTAKDLDQLIKMKFQRAKWYYEASRVYKTDKS